MTETNESTNGARPSPDPEQLQAVLQQAIDEYARALARSKIVGAQVQVNAVDLLIQCSLNKIQLELLLEGFAAMGVVELTNWKQALTQRLRVLTAELPQAQPTTTILVAPAGAIPRKQ